jgi:hypothetical protein
MIIANQAIPSSSWKIQSTTNFAAARALLYGKFLKGTHLRSTQQVWGAELDVRYDLRRATAVRCSVAGRSHATSELEGDAEGPTHSIQTALARTVIWHGSRVGCQVAPRPSRSDRRCSPRWIPKA